MMDGWKVGRLAIVGTALFLSACVPVETGPGLGPLPPRPGPERPQACTFEYAPVCARRGRDERTFSNACMARVEGYRISSPGECRGGGGGGPVGPGPGPGPERPAMCTREYAPVCATRGRRQETFSNACLARSEGFQVRSPGECRPSGRPSRPRG